MLRAGTRVEQASTRHLSPTPSGVWPAGRAMYAESHGNTGTQLLETGPVGNIGQGPGSHLPRLNLVVDRPPGWTRCGLAPTTSRDKTCVPCAHEVPRTTLRCGRDPTLKHCLRCANASLHVQCCDANIRLAARLRIRSLLEAHRAHTNSTTQACCGRGAQLNGARHGPAPHGVYPLTLPASRGVVEGALPHVYTVGTVPRWLMGPHHKQLKAHTV